MKRITALVLTAILTAVLTAGCGGAQDSKQDSAETQTEEAQAGETAAAEEADSTEPAGELPLRHVEIEIADYGVVSLELDPNQAPITVDNFIKLAESGFYDGLTFHRIMNGFMIQGGDPEGNGYGGSGETIKGEFARNGVNNTISHREGVISMARSQDPDSASSQFFIMVDDGDFLDGEYAAFGWVTEGQDIIDKIAADAQPIDNNGTIPPEDQPVILRITVLD